MPINDMMSPPMVPAANGNQKPSFWGSISIFKCKCLSIMNYKSISNSTKVDSGKLERA